jgi:hypothetical protein
MRCMSTLILALLPLLCLTLAVCGQTPPPEPSQQPAAPLFTAVDASRYARMALECVHKEYPNKIAHVLNSKEDARAPSELTPAFHGCYDWHSAVHGHWLLVRVLRRFPEVSEGAAIRAALKKSITAAHIEAELTYLKAPGRVPFERPYGLAWLLQLAAELRQWDDSDARELSRTLAPLEVLCAERIRDWLPKLTHPIRTGEHSQTAFAFGLIRDWAVIVGDEAMIALIDARARAYHLQDRGWPMSFEPSGQDFLSPGLAVADLMRRVLPQKEFGEWLSGYLPEIPREQATPWIAPAVVTDKSDGKLAHLDGLNLSRAWMLEGIAQALEPGDARLPSLRGTAHAHRNAGLAAVIDAPYEGSHWLGSFAVYLVTGRGLGD